MTQLTPGTTYRITVGKSRRLDRKDFARAVADLRALGGCFDHEDKVWIITWDGESALGLVIQRYDLTVEAASS